jgi:hypothetical protein
MDVRNLGLAGVALAVLACQPRAEQAGEATVRDSALADAGPSVQNAGRSDTLHVYVHHVKAGKEADYETWVRDVWMPAVEKAAQKYPEVGQANQGQRLFAPTQKQKNGSSDYVWLYEPAPPASVATANWIYPDSFLVAGGYSPEEAAAQARALWAMVTAGGGEVVRKF